MRPASPDPELLALRGVSKSFGSTRALAPLDLALPTGRTTALLGPSGCGKSTVLRMCAGLVRPDRGEVRFDGRPVTPESAPELRLRMGYVIQDGGLFPHLTARDNVTLMARELGRDACSRETRLYELASLTRFPGDALDRFPSQLSGGQRQRVGLMRALMLDPDLLLLDEPLGALDPMIRSELQADLRTIFEELGKTVLLVTHDIGEAGYLADRIALLRDGELVQVGTLEELVRSPADPFVTRFVNAQRSPLEALAERGP